MAFGISPEILILTTGNILLQKYNLQKSERGRRKSPLSLNSLIFFRSVLKSNYQEEFFER